ncbi:hypothetical protein GCM10027047_33620 [Rhodococcus aerolatus]
MTTTETDAWTATTWGQHGVLTRAQLKAHGLDDHAVAHRVRQRRWQRVLHGVVAVHTGPLTRPAVLTAALLYAGDHAALSHRTAAQEWDLLRDDDQARVHVTVPYSRSAAHQPPVWGPCGLVHPGVAVHRSRAFAHVVVESDPPRTSLADTVLDLAVAEPDARAAVRRLVGLSTGGRVSAAALRARVEARRPRRYRTALLEALTLMTDGVTSVLEHRYAVEVERAHGLPAARRQSPVVVDGHVLLEDCDYSEHGVPLVVRLDGRAYHSSPEVAFRDRRRDNAAELAGRPRLVYGWTDVVRDPCGVAAEVAAVLHREGWTGELHACAACL